MLKGETEFHTNMTIEAAQCTLDWCINSYEASVTNGRLSERVLRSWQPLKEQWVFTEGELMAAVDSTAPRLPGANDTSNYTISIPAETSLGNWLAGKFTFSDSYAVTVGDRGEFYWMPDVSNDPSNYLEVDGGFGFLHATSDTLPLFRTGNTSEIISKLAKAITSYIRSLNETEKTFERYLEYNVTGVGPVIGITYASHIYISVQWPWLAFSGSLLVLTIIFFGLVAAQSAKDSVTIWKSSPLALLFHGLNPGTLGRLQDTMEVEDMKIRAKEMRVRLRHEESGAGLECVNSA
ncbi:uncharacterized protein K460DRAFT_424950 [Cucurbitaria berberidis CBS 394.84]|uniref:Uncharacterized protein n=1 Tax=Cucurbitaria berberidis CBS 394.84 TaxID=1168544 RepID=A0A9P4LFE9_9PLEO|nr:uncharacterized protein K460DRAFT_424950 [Cucurbitaria berberidis CBS 394.84]KAF1852004.1 hypothetical protein K460DRAFT_424950 [Cucurbitaria berberidis CBS 394.84]